MTSTARALRLRQQAKADGSVENESEVLGRSVIDPAISASVAIQGYGSHLPGVGDINSTVEEVQRITAAVKCGDLSDLEGMLVAQAIALQTISANFMNRAQLQTAQRNFEAFFGMALKAQAQSRTTVQALVDLKYPRQVVFAKNVGNVNNGQQQINTGSAPHGVKAGPAQIKQLEARDGKWMDTGAARATSGAHPYLASVGEVHRSPNRARKGARVA